MTFVRSFDDFAPPPRFDGLPFTTALIQEAPSKTGTWATIDTKTLTPADLDPEHPVERDFTTSLATLDPVAWYRFIWRDASLATFTGSPVLYDGSPGVFVTVGDVERVLEIDLTAQQVTAVTAAIKVAESWARRFLRDPNLGIAGSFTETHYDIREDGPVPAAGTITQVKIFPGTTGSGSVLDAGSWTFDGSRVRLRPSLASDDYPYGSSTGDGSLGERLPGWYTKVEVTSTRTTDVDPVIVQGVALATAAIWTRSPRLGKGLRGESLGDYSYTVSASVEQDPFFQEAMSLLRPLRRGRAVVV